MQIHDIQPKNKNQLKKRIGRGGKKGTYSGKGVKGQKCRAGRKMQPSIREIIKRYPKLRGYRQEVKYNFSSSIATGALEKHFKAGDKITPSALITKGLIVKMKGRVPRIKIIVRGELKKKLAISGLNVSAKAKEMIEKAKGTIA